MAMNKDLRINVLNIGLMIVSCIAAFMMPFEVFLFAYAFMGPLHYLTEISWLHDRQYFAKGKYDYIVLLSIGVILSLWDFASNYKWWPFNNAENVEMAQHWNIYEKLLFIAFFSGLIVAFVKNHLLKILGIAFVFFLSLGIYGQLYSDNTAENGEGLLTMLLTSFVPTLIHVYVFTGFFMLFGALKSRSKSGIVSVIVFVICPLLLFFLFRNSTFVPVTSYGKEAYGNALSGEGFFGLNKEILDKFFGQRIPQPPPAITTDVQYRNFYNIEWSKIVFHSSIGVLVTRFIAFAYMYHYLNWFSKTEIIRWHKVPKSRFVIVIILWLVSVGLYAYNYKVGLQWLFFLSFTHVLLEFPLNFTSIAGIGRELSAISRTGFRPKVAPVK